MAREPTSVWEVVAIAPERRAFRKECVAFWMPGHQFRCKSTTMHLYGAQNGIGWPVKYAVCYRTVAFAPPDRRALHRRKGTRPTQYRHLQPRFFGEHDLQPTGIRLPKQQLCKQGHPDAIQHIKAPYRSPQGQRTSITSKLVVMSAVLPSMMLAEQYLS